MVTEKLLSDGRKGVEARLVVRGFEEDDKVQADSPTASKSTLQIAFAVIANEGWKCEIIDIKAVFLQGRRIERDVFVKPPREVREEGTVWKLEKAAYGLDDASRHWYFSVREDLISFDCKQSEIDKALFRWYQHDQLKRHLSDACGMISCLQEQISFSGMSLIRLQISTKLENIKIEVLHMLD